jgi:hypothetical protein
MCVINLSLLQMLGTKPFRDNKNKFSGTAIDQNPATETTQSESYTKGNTAKFVA